MQPFVRDTALLIARVLLTSLFILFGWDKLVGFAGTVGYMQHLGMPLPTLGAALAVFMELGVGLAILAGWLTRPLALLLAAYTVATAFIGHPFWTMDGADQMAGKINFFKNMSITGGLIVLSIEGAGRYAIDHLTRRA